MRSLKAVRLALTCASIFAIAPVSADEPPAFPCAAADAPCRTRFLREHPVHRLATWRADRALPLDQRVGPATPQLASYLNLDNIANGYPERPRVPKLDPGFLADVKAAIAELPPQVWRLFDQRLVGIFFVDDLGGSGYTDFVTDEDGKQVAGLIVLDARVLGRLTANEWATWKEGTPFKADGVWRLQARIEADANNNRKNAIQYILLHELAHVLSIGGDVHPPWDVKPRETRVWPRYPFFDLSWKVQHWDNEYRSLFEHEFPQRKNVAYYFGSRLAAADMAPTYANLARTNFPSLYAATRPADDFAEAFASYVHVVMQQRPWEIVISRDGAPVQTFKACWDEPRCAAKRKLLEKMLAPAP